MNDTIEAERVTRPPEVVLKGIATVYDNDDPPVLHNLRLRVPPGEITILMGPSGSGKTTLIRHIAGLLQPTRGTVHINERNVWAGDEQDLRALRREMGFMLGGSHLWTVSIFGSMSVIDNLLYSLEAHNVPLADQQPRAMAALASLGLEADAERMPEHLPAHACKRLAIARALVVRAPLVILDEVELGLDNIHSKSILTALKRHNERTGCTMLVSTHSLTLARTIGDSLAVLGNGRILAHGPVEATLADIQTSEDLAAKFLVRDPIGPPQKGDLGPDVDEADFKPERKEWYIDDRVIWVGVIGLILVAFLVVILTNAPQ